MRLQWVRIDAIASPDEVCREARGRAVGVLSSPSGPRCIRREFSHRRGFGITIPRGRIPALTNPCQFQRACGEISLKLRVSLQPCDRCRAHEPAFDDIALPVYVTDYPALPERPTTSENRVRSIRRD